MHFFVFLKRGTNKFGEYWYLNFVFTCQHKANFCLTISRYERCNQNRILKLLVWCVLWHWHRDTWLIRWFTIRRNCCETVWCLIQKGYIQSEKQSRMHLLNVYNEHYICFEITIYYLVYTLWDAFIFVFHIKTKSINIPEL